MYVPDKDVMMQIQKLSFYDQITCFEKTKAAIVRKIGKESAEELCNEAIYFIGLGIALYS